MTMKQEELNGIRERIIGLRTARGLTQRQLADRAGVDLSGLGKIEQGNSKRPVLETLMRISQFLGVSLDYVATGEGPEGEDQRGLAEYDRFVKTHPAAANARPEDLRSLRVAAAHPPLDRDVTQAYLQAVLAAITGFLNEREAVDFASDSDSLDKH